MSTLRTIIVANRLPVKINVKEGKWAMEASEGGLATGLKGIWEKENTLWIGWPGAFLPEVTQKEVNQALKTQRLAPVWLSSSDIDGFYNGFSNAILWPLFHYFSSMASFDVRYWEAYKSVNAQFAKEVLKYARNGDIIWIHDYQLLLLPALIRAALPDAKIGFFQHIPFPSKEIFRQIPWREELLKGMLGADLIGFHTNEDGLYFKSAVRQFVPVATKGENICNANGKRVKVKAFPMGIDYEKYQETAGASATRRNERKIQDMTGNKKIIVSVDRLDYSKGILERLNGYDLFLEQNPEFGEKVIFIQLVVPSRDNVTQYALLKEQINRKVSDINAKRGTFSWQPISYFYRALPPNMLSALYTTAAVALVTPLRDGMNLVSKEYVASRIRQDGVLVLSELAGASRELTEALTINPFNSQHIANAIMQGLTMPLEEQQRRMRRLQAIVKANDVYHWAEAFIGNLTRSKPAATGRDMMLHSGPARNTLVQYTYPPRA